MTLLKMAESSFEELLDRLRLAQDLVRDETDELARTGIGDRATLWRLGRMARSHQEQANSLLITMLEQCAPEDLLHEAEALAGFFNAAVTRIEAMLASGWRG